MPFSPGSGKQGGSETGLFLPGWQIFALWALFPLKVSWRGCERRYDKNKLRFAWQEGCWQGLEFRWLYKVKAGGRPGDGSGGGRIHENLLPGLIWLGAGSSSPSAGLFPTPVLWGPQDCYKGTASHPLQALLPLYSHQIGKNMGCKVGQTWAQNPVCSHQL